MRGEPDGRFGRAARSDREESPDSMRQRCRVTPGRGNPRDSATENKPLRSAEVRVKRWGKSPPRTWQQGRHGKPHREQCQIGVSCGVGPFGDTATQGRFSPRDPGWQLERVGNGGPRGMVIEPRQRGEQNPAYRLSAFTFCVNHLLTVSSTSEPICRGHSAPVTP